MIILKQIIYNGYDLKIYWYSSHGENFLVVFNQLSKEILYPIFQYFPDQHICDIRDQEGQGSTYHGYNIKAS